MIFNKEKSAEDYSNISSPFFTGEPGLIDTIHKSKPKIWSLYKEMKSLDWDENEFDYTQCFEDFKNVDSNTREMMLETLMWQWEADSIASRFPLVLISPFQPCQEIIEAETAIQANELVHANTYSEIVRMSFDNPNDVLSSMLENKESFERMDAVNLFLEAFQKYSISVTYHGEHNQKRAYQKLLEYYFTMLCMERIQFMASFAITFTICKTGLFQPIGQAVKKIAQDELEVHAEYRKQVISEILKIDKSEYNGEIFRDARDNLIMIYEEVLTKEFAWTEYLFTDRNLIGTSPDLIKKWVLYNAKNVYNFIGFTKEEINDEYSKFPRSNPLPYLEDWFNMNLQQAAPQEQDIASYKTSTIVRDDANIKFDF